MHAARPDDDQQPLVGPLKDCVHVLAAADHDVRLPAAQRQLIEQGVGREQGHHPRDPAVADVVGRAHLGAG